VPAVSCVLQLVYRLLAADSLARAAGDCVNILPGIYQKARLEAACSSVGCIVSVKRGALSTSVPHALPNNAEQRRSKRSVSTCNSPHSMPQARAAPACAQQSFSDSICPAQTQAAHRKQPPAQLTTCFETNNTCSTLEAQRNPTPLFKYTEQIMYSCPATLRHTFLSAITSWMHAQVVD
jgi:hypothetical protein